MGRYLLTGKVSLTVIGWAHMKNKCITFKNKILIL